MLSTRKDVNGWRFVALEAFGSMLGPLRASLHQDLAPQPYCLVHHAEIGNVRGASYCLIYRDLGRTPPANTPD